MTTHWRRELVRAVIATIAAGALTQGCSERRELTTAPPPTGPLTYASDIKPIFDVQCVSCHNPASSQGDYDMSTYDAVLGNGSDGTPNAIPGDPTSKLVVNSLPGGAMNSFYASSAQVEAVRQWVVEDGLAEQ